MATDDAPAAQALEVSPEAFDELLRGPPEHAGRADCGIGRRWTGWLMEWRGKRAFRAATDPKGAGAPMPQKLPDGRYATARYWGISKPQLEKLFAWCQRQELWNSEDNVRVFNEKFIKPICRRTGMSVALTMNQHAPKPISVMISHGWDENAKHFFEDLLGSSACTVARGRSVRFARWGSTTQHGGASPGDCAASLLEHEVAYICLLCNPQGEGHQVKAMLGSQVDSLPFTEVIWSDHCRRMLVAPCDELKEQLVGLYSRLWCIWEVKVAVDRGIPIHFTHRIDAADLSTKRAYLLGSPGRSSKDARCGSSSDTSMIRAAIESKSLPCLHVTILAFSASAAFYGYINLFTTLFVPAAGDPDAPRFASYIALSCVVFHIVRRCVGALLVDRGTDNYRKLDEIVVASVQRRYCLRRPANRDVARMMVGAVIGACVFRLCGLLAEASFGDGFNAALAVILRKDVKALHQDLYFRGAHQGAVCAIASDVNMFGVAHGMYFKGVRDQRVAGALVLLGHFLSTWGLMLLVYAVDRDAACRYGHGTFGQYLADYAVPSTDLLGFFVGWALVAATYGWWRHALKVAGGASLLLPSPHLCGLVLIIACAVLGNLLAGLAWERGVLADTDYILQKGFMFPGFAAHLIAVAPGWRSVARVRAGCLAIVACPLSAVALFLATSSPDPAAHRQLPGATAACP